jgi:hypothetical protein
MSQDRQTLAQLSIVPLYTQQVKNYACCGIVVIE